LGEDVGIRKGRMIVHMVDVFLLLYKNRRMKPVQIVLRRGGRGRMMEGENPTKIYF
jgi:hypothetical protein